MKRRDDLLATGTVALVAVGYAACVVWRNAQTNDAPPTLDTFNFFYDLYGYFYPNMLYALDSLGRGEGLLWNRYQNCGQPFFAITLTALAYPFHLVLLLVDADRALCLLFGAHLLVGGLGMYALVRALDGTPWGALCGAAAFQLSALTLWIAYWSPINFAVYAWIPVVMAATEWVLRRPAAARVVGLAAALAAQLLAGYPQISLFTYQLVTLRLVWELATGDRMTRGRAVAAVAVAAVLAPLLVAVQLLPALEMARESIRNRALTPAEIRVPGLAFSWEGFRTLVGMRFGYGAFVSVTTGALILLAWYRRGSRRPAIFYALAAALSFALAFDTPLFDLYRRLPLGSTFREPERLLWITAVASCALAGLGASSIADRGRHRWLALLAPAAAGAGLLTLSPTGLTAVEVGALAGLSALLALAQVPALAAVVRCALLGILVGELLLAGSLTLAYPRDGRTLFWQRDAYAELRARMSAQDRMYPLFAPHPGDGQTERVAYLKAAELWAVPSVVDYEPQTSDRYARLLVWLWYGQPMRSINQYYYKLKAVPRHPALLNLLAARFILADETQLARTRWPSGPGYRLVWQGGSHRIFENLTALPRAFYVPQSEVLADESTVLARLTAREFDPRRLALVDGGAPALRGAPGGIGAVDIVTDRGEELTLRVRANQPGYVFLSDQHYPGWEATVNGASVTIERANFAFRLVAVPAGESTVIFSYRPRSLVVGAWISAGALAATSATFIWAVRRRRRRHHP